MLLKGTDQNDYLAGDHNGSNDLYGYEGDDELEGQGFEDLIFGHSGDDTIDGGGGNDMLYGMIGSDVILGGDGNDYLYGGQRLGLDTLIGGRGDDTYVLPSRFDDLRELAGEGTDTVISDELSCTLGANFENLLFTQASGITGIGNNLNNVIAGQGLDNHLSGLGGSDTLEGGGGNDLIVGGLGQDILTGGSNIDLFDFNSVKESTQKRGDLITDFTHLTDRIDLETIDANTKLAGNQAFRFIGGQQFHGIAGEFHVVRVNNPGTQNDFTKLEGDTNGDRVADLNIVLKGLVTISAADFDL